MQQGRPSSLFGKSLPPLALQLLVHSAPILRLRSRVSVPFLDDNPEFVVPFDRACGELLCNLPSERYERRPTLITTNLAFSDWVHVFGDAKLTATPLDRLGHHSHALAPRGPSFRNRSKIADADPAPTPPQQEGGERHRNRDLKYCNRAVILQPGTCSKTGRRFAQFLSVASNGY